MLDAIRGASLAGKIRVGFGQDFIDPIVTQCLSRFTQHYPLVQLEVQIDRNLRLEEAVNAGSLDIALILGEGNKKGARKLGTVPLQWFAGNNLRRSKDPLPLILADAPCMFRARAIDALDQVGKTWRVALTSTSVTGLWAAVGANLGVTARARLNTDDALQIPDSELPALGVVEIYLLRRKGARAAHIERLAELIAETTFKTYGLDV